MELIHRYTAVLVIDCGQTILLQKAHNTHDHTNEEIFDLFGIGIDKSQTEESVIEALRAQSPLSKTVSIQQFGHILNVIHTPNKIVTLHLSVFRASVDKESIQINDKLIWVDKTAAMTDRRSWRIRKLLENTPEPFQHIWEEDQLENWAHAKTLRWEKIQETKRAH